MFRGNQAAKVVPIYKAEKHYMQNHRSISLTSNIAKNVQKIIHIRIENVVNHRKILNEKIWFY